jgi:hypothetical protein
VIEMYTKCARATTAQGFVTDCNRGALTQGEG